MLDDAIEEMRKALPNLTEQQQKVGKYFCEHPDSLGVLSLGEFAAHTGTSEPTVIRFCRAMGYSGFLDFSRRMQEMRQNKISQASYFRHARIKSEKCAEDGDLAHQLVARDEANIHKLMENYPRENIRKCVELMKSSSIIYVIGRFSAFPAAIYFEQLLSKITPKLYPLNGADVLQISAISRMDKNCLVFCLAFPRYSKVIVNLAREVAQKGASIVSITKNNASPLAQVSDILFPCNVEMVSYIDLYGPVFALINILCLEFSLSQSTQSETDLAKYDYVGDKTFFITNGKYSKLKDGRPDIYAS